MSQTLNAHTPIDALLDGADAPASLSRLSDEALVDLAGRIRQYLIANVCATGGHLGSNLGVVELTLAAHRVFDSPHDLILFDTGHQAYVHKMLTGRLGRFSSLRQRDGLSGYPCRAESEHDLIENSHASTALSYADGLAKAFWLQGSNRRIVTVVGDGAMTGGMCWEALNNIGSAPHRPVIVLLNDNGRSYSPTVGGFARHLAELRQAPREGDQRLSDKPRHNLFEDLGFSYIGPVDGHDLNLLQKSMTRAAELARPVVVHCLTSKGRGYSPAENDAKDCLHSVAATDPGTGRAIRTKPRSWTSVFAEEITAIGSERDDIVCLTAAMLHPTGLGEFAARFPDRVFDIGIAEQHAVTSAAGLAMGGLHPVVAIYASFIGRAVDQLIMDVALHRLPVTIVTDRAGVTGPDGASHHGMWDASILPVIPGVRIAAPRDPARIRELLREALNVTNGPTVIRYPKADAGADLPAQQRRRSFDELLVSAQAQVLLVAVGPMADPCMEAAGILRDRGLHVAVMDPRWTTPLEPSLLSYARHYRLVIAVEDNTSTGAMGARLAQALGTPEDHTRVETLALPPQFLPHGPRDELLRSNGLDGPSIATAILKRVHWLRAGAASPRTGVMAG